MINIDNILKFNTGRSYTANGQRIAAISVDGGVFMRDKDRDLHYFFPDCQLSQNEIMRRYDYNENCKYSCDSVNAFGMWELINLMDKDWLTTINQWVASSRPPRRRKSLVESILHKKKICWH